MSDLPLSSHSLNTIIYNDNVYISEYNIEYIMISYPEQFISYPELGWNFTDSIKKYYGATSYYVQTEVY
uniref:Uncharacterized protein n=1 Tax=viral metagenome TaxID=1070528 RepID=A0A6C0J9T6_9ZZZZ